MSLYDLLFGKKEKELYQGKTIDDKPLYNFPGGTSKYLGVSRFLVLGSMKRQDKNTCNNIKKAIKEMGFNDKVIFITKNSEHLKFGVIQTPALVVDGKVVTYGKHLKINDVKELFEKYGIEYN